MELNYVETNWESKLMLEQLVHQGEMEEIIENVHLCRQEVVGIVEKDLHLQGVEMIVHLLDVEMILLPQDVGKMIKISIEENLLQLEDILQVVVLLLLVEKDLMMIALQLVIKFKVSFIPQKLSTSKIWLFLKLVRSHLLFSFTPLSPSLP